MRVGTFAAMIYRNFKRRKGDILILKDMSLKDIIAGLTYYKGRYSSIVRANDDNNTIIIKNITYNDFLEIEKISLQIINNFNNINEPSLDLKTYEAVRRIREYIVEKI